MKTIPITAAGFEKDFHQLKNNKENILKYILNIPCPTVETLFKHTEVQYDIFKGALESI